MCRPNNRSSDSPIMIRQFNTSDILTIVSKFAEHNWPKPIATFERYLQEQCDGNRLIWVAYLNNQFAGYVTLAWMSKYQPFRDDKIPEIMDLNVLPPFRSCGIGSKLLEVAETAAGFKNNYVGLGVGLYADYGVAQKLYLKRGYIPDGRGITYDYQFVLPGSSVRVDDDLLLWLLKQLK